MSQLVYFAVLKHLKESKLTFDLIAFQLGIGYGELAIALIQMHEAGELEVVYMKDGEPVFYLKED